MKNQPKHTKLKLLAYHQYQGVDLNDPIRFYYWPLLGSLYRKRVEMCLDKCQGGERILEVGFGTGLSFLNLQELYQEIYGLDLEVSIEQVKAVFESREVNLNLRNGTVLQMPYENGFFDTVLLVSILEHLKPGELELAFSEIRRVLKPGGQVVFGIPVERPFMAATFRLMGVNIREHHYSTHEDVIKAVKKIFDNGKSSVDFLNVFPVGKLYQVGCFLRP